MSKETVAKLIEVLGNHQELSTKAPKDSIDFYKWIGEYTKSFLKGSGFKFDESTEEERETLADNILKGFDIKLTKTEKLTIFVEGNISYFDLGNEDGLNIDIDPAIKEELSDDDWEYSGYSDDEGELAEDALKEKCIEFSDENCEKGCDGCLFDIEDKGNVLKQLEEMFPKSQALDRNTKFDTVTKKELSENKKQKVSIEEFDKALSVVEKGLEESKDIEVSYMIHSLVELLCGDIYWVKKHLSKDNRNSLRGLLKYTR